jgi:hypothetical protein
VNDDELWICLLDVDGAYVYGAGRAPSVLTLVAALTDELERRGLQLTAIEWLNAYDALPAQQRESEPIASLVEAAGDGVALSDSEPYEEADEQKERILAFISNWVDNAVEHGGGFELGDFAFVAEMRYDAEDPMALGWAYAGALRNAGELFSRAARQAEGAEDD